MQAWQIWPFDILIVRIQPGFEIKHDVFCFVDQSMSFMVRVIYLKVWLGRQTSHRTKTDKWQCIFTTTSSYCDFKVWYWHFITRYSRLGKTVTIMKGFYGLSCLLWNHVEVFKSIVGIHTELVLVLGSFVLKMTASSISLIASAGFCWRLHYLHRRLSYRPAEDLHHFMPLLTEPFLLQKQS